MSICILITEDHELVRKGYRLILERRWPNASVCESPDVTTSLVHLDEGDWNLVILDIDLPGRSGMELLKYIRENHIPTSVLVLSMYEESEFGVRAIKSGANAYLTKGCSSATFIECVETLLGGENYITPTMGSLLARVVAATESSTYGAETLTDREYEVALQISRGKSVTQIAEEMNLSIKTISTYRTRALKKLGKRSNVELARWFLDEQQNRKNDKA